MPEVLTEPWAVRVMEEHKELRAKVQEIRTFLEQSRPEVGQTGAHTWAVALARRIFDLHDRLVLHFRFEERSGMAEEFTVQYPRAAQELDDILADHPAILSQLREIVTCALIYSEGHTPSDAALRRKTTAVLDYLGRHERQETSLIQRVEYRDFGVGD